VSDEVRRGLAPVAAVLVALAAPAPVAAAAEIARLDEQRAAPVVLGGAGRPTSLRLAFDLPAGAKQGPERWYAVRLRYRLWLEPSSRRGFVWVTSATNGRTHAQIEYTTSRRRGRLFVRRTTVDLEHGQRERRGAFSRDALTFENYLPYAGVRPGANEWTIRLEAAGGARVRRMEVLGSTAIRETTRTPFPLTLDVSVDGDAPRVGERFRLKVVLATAPGSRPIRDIVVRAGPAAEGGVVEGLRPSEQRIAELTGGRRVLTFPFLARAQGTAAIAVSARSGANDPNAGVRVQVAPAERAASVPAGVWGLAALPVIAMSAYLLRARMRRMRV
jgi:hypothetical protein